MAGKCRLPCPEHRMGEAGDPQERVRTCLRCLPLEGGIGVWRENRNIALNIIFRCHLYTRIFADRARLVASAHRCSARTARRHGDSKLRVNVALAALSGEEQGVVLDPHIAVALSSVSNELRLATQARKQLKTDYEAAAALCRNVGMSCKQLREARVVYCYSKGLTADDLALLVTLGSVLPAARGADPP